MTTVSTSSIRDRGSLSYRPKVSTFCARILILVIWILNLINSWIGDDLVVWEGWLLDGGWRVWIFRSAFECCIGIQLTFHWIGSVCLRWEIDIETFSDFLGFSDDFRTQRKRFFALVFESLVVGIGGGTVAWLCSLRGLWLLGSVVVKSLVELELLHVFSILYSHILRDVRLWWKHTWFLTCISHLRLWLFLCSINHTLHIYHWAVSFLPTFKSVACCSPYLNVHVVGAGPMLSIDFR